MKRVIILSLAICMLMTCFSVAFAKSFSDVPSTHWSYKYVDELSNKGIINGYEDGSFKPDGNVTKAEFIKLVMVVYWGSATFDEYSGGDAWYSKYFSFANQDKLLTETVQEKYANEPITRYEIVEVLSRVIDANKNLRIDFSNIYDGAKGQVSDEDIKASLDLFSSMTSAEQLSLMSEIELRNSKDKKNHEYQLANFEDCKDLDKSQNDMINLVAYVGLITGYEDGTFRYKNNVTRAEVATIVMRLVDSIGYFEI